MLPSDQLELFKSKPRGRGKSFRGANGFQLSYWRLPKGRIRVQLSDGQLIDITKESPGRSGRPRLYTKVPGHEGIVQGRNLKPFLAQLTLIDQIRALNRSVQIKLKQLDDATRTLSDVTKDDAADTEEEKVLAELQRLKAENGRLCAEIEAEKTRSAQAPKDDAREPRTAGQSINVRAVQWAYAQDLHSTAKTVLLTFAIHSNECGYSWPSVNRIACTWQMDRDTVRRQIEELLIRGKIRRTKKRRGATGQVKVYRLPKITYESGGKSRPFQRGGSGGEARDKRGISGGESAPNKEYRVTKEQVLESNREPERGARNEQAPEGEMPSATRRYAEEQLLGLLSIIMKPSEIIQNGGMWRERIRFSPKAIIEVIKLYERLSPEKRSQIKNPAAWATDQYASHGGKPLIP